MKTQLINKLTHLFNFKLMLCILLFYYTDPMCLAINRESMCFISEKNCPERYLYDSINNLD